jgi:hypothetical protein
MAETSRRDPSASRCTAATRARPHAIGWTPSSRANATRRAVLLLLLTLACLGLAVPSAAAWSNGGDYGNGFGTHDWVLYEANQLAESEGYLWLRTGAALRATDDPDMVLHDTYHHVYDVWGTTYGDAPDRVQTLFNRAVRQIRDDRPRAASRTFGLLAHYYADICNPTHTDSSGREERMHARHESATNTRTNSRNENDSWVDPGDVRVRSGARGPATRAATWAHQYYWTLVKNYAANGWTSTNAAITHRCLSRAVNDLADLIVSVREAAR